MKKVIFTLSCTSAVLLSACSATPPSKPKNIGMPNPASQYCIDQGGKLEMKNSPEGQYANCILPNGQVIEEWQFFRQNHPTK